MTEWRFARAKGVLLVFLSLLGGLATLDAGVSVTAGWDRYGGREQSQTFSRLELASAKALALDAAARRGVHVGLVVGMSTADWGIDLRGLESASEKIHWAKLTGEFASFTNLLEIVRRIEDTKVRPTRTLLCIHAGMLLGAQRQKITRAQRLAQVLERVGQSHSSSELARAVTLSWLGNNRASYANELELGLGRVRERVLAWFGQPPDIIYPAVADPFDDTLNVHAHMHPSVRQRHVSQAQERWRVAQVAAARADEQAQARALTEIVEMLGRNSDLVIVLMPEHSTLRAVVPEPFALGLLDDALRASELGHPVPVLDLRAALPDEYFADEVHATAEGRPVLTRALARALSEPPPVR